MSSVFLTQGLVNEILDKDGYTQGLVSYGENFVIAVSCTGWVAPILIDSGYGGIFDKSDQKETYESLFSGYFYENLVVREFGEIPEKNKPRLREIALANMKTSFRTGMSSREVLEEYPHLLFGNQQSSCFEGSVVHNHIVVSVFGMKYPEQNEEVALFIAECLYRDVIEKAKSEIQRLRRESKFLLP